METIESRIVIDPNICNGKPTIKGTRITVNSIIEYISAGDSIDDILEGFPNLTREDVEACLRFASELMNRNFEILTLV
jgi:uncharacterized protein (DUF433 family)